MRRLSWWLRRRRIQKIAAPIHEPSGWGNTCIFCDKPRHYGPCDGAS